MTFQLVHQILIIPEHRNYLRFHWVNDVFKNSPSIVKLRLAQVIFSVTSSPILLNETVRIMYQAITLTQNLQCKYYDRVLLMIFPVEIKPQLQHLNYIIN